MKFLPLGYFEGQAKPKGHHKHGSRWAIETVRLMRLAGVAAVALLTEEDMKRLRGDHEKERDTCELEPS